MNENKNEGIPGLSKQSIKMDILLFKDDILKDMREIQRTLDRKYLKTEDNLNSKINMFETKINIFEKKIFELSNKINIDKKIRENVELLNKFKEETSDTIFKRRVKYNDFEKRMNDEINRINDILIDTVIYPSFIGANSKFKTFHEFMDYVLEEIAQFKIYKDKTGIDLGPFKKKIEQSIDTLKIQLNNIINISKEFTNSSIEQSEEKIKSLLKIYDDRLQDAKVEISHYNMVLDKKTEEFEKEINNIRKMQEEFLKNFDNQIHKNKNLEETFKYYNNEINILNNKINKMVSIIKELLSFFKNNNIKNKEKKSKIYSGVKQYINGLLNADELFTKKTFKKNEDSSSNQEIKRTNTEFNKKNGFLNNDISNIKNNIKEYDKRKKKLVSKKTFNFNNFSNYKNLNEINNEKSKNKIYAVRDLYSALNSYNENINEEGKEKKLLRRMSYNYTNISYTQSKNKESLEKRNSGIEFNSRNSFKFPNKNNDSSFNFSEETDNDNNLSKKSSPKSQFIIKEEDENNLSENSFQNIKEKSKSKKSNNKDLKKNNSIQLTNDNLINYKIINEGKTKKQKLLDIKGKSEDNKLKNESNKNINKINYEIKEENNEKLNNFIKDKNNKNNDNNKNANIIINKKVNNISKTDINNNVYKNNNYNYKTGLNSLRKNNNYKGIPLLDLLGYTNENYSKRSQSSKKRNIHNNILFKNNINQENNSYKNEDKLFMNSYINTNYQMNNGYQILPYVKNEITSKMVDFLPNNSINKTKLINHENINPQIFNSNKNRNLSTCKKLKLASPDNLFFNTFISKKDKRIMKNKSFGIIYERSNEAKDLENLFNKLQSYIPSYKEKNLPEEIEKSFKDSKIYKSPNKYK